MNQSMIGSKPPIWRRLIVKDNIGLDQLHSVLQVAAIKGKKACPPEDCGGIWGYSDFLDAIQDPKHEEHESML